MTLQAAAWHGKRTLRGWNSVRPRLRNSITPKIMITTEISRPRLDSDAAGRNNSAAASRQTERTVMSYDLDQFIADCRANLKQDPGPAGREKVRQALERLLKEQDFIAKHCSDETPAGLHVLHDDPELGFQILAHINAKARTSPPHDHGHSWAIYGQATSYTDMTEYRRIDDGTSDRAELAVTTRYRLTPGQAGIYQDGAIHAIDYPDRSRFVRVTGTNLDKITRSRFDLATGKMAQMTPQQAT
jgi:predicted metal-dependent enzyme (double-stranded beta helix superfamily)